MSFGEIIKQYDSYTIEREKPKNLFEADEVLFRHELKRTFKGFSIIRYSNAWIDSGGLIANSWFSISTYSLANLRIKHTDIKKRLKQTIKLTFKRSAGTKEDVVWISERWSHGYFHWFCDALTRFYVNPELTSGKTILLPAHYESFRYIPESLDFLGLKHCFIPRKHKVKTKSVVLPQPTSGPGNYFPPAIRNLRAALLKKVKNKTGPKRIFISRQKAKIRKIMNHEQCLEILNKYGFEEIIMEGFSFKEQIEMLQNTEIVMGVHGAGLTNMLVCPDNTKIVEIRGKNDASNNCFFSLASALNFEYFYILADSNPTEHDLVGNVTLNPIVLESFLQDFCSSN